MNTIEERVEAVGQGLDPRWDAERTEIALLGLGRKRRRRRVVRGGLATLALGAAAFLLAGRATPPSLAPKQVATLGATSLAPAPARVPVPCALKLNDGSTVACDDASTEVRLSEQTPRQITVDLVSGRAHFSVSERRDRVFRVRAGEVSVLVLGTVFSVDRSGERVRVSVHRGVVLVDRGQDERLLSAGEEESFSPQAPPPGAPAALDTETSRVVAVATAKPRRPSRKLRDAAPDATATQADGLWRRLALAGAMREAYELLRTVQVKNDPEDLLLAADAARRSGHPEGAVTYLDRLVREHPQDHRAALAAFTLGRLLLGAGRAAEAAQAFARARSSAPGGVLAEDALAREVESWAAAGERARARTAAEQYVSSYANGRRLEAVKRLGGLDAGSR